MNDLIRTVADTFAFNSSLVSLALSDLTDEDALKRSEEGRGNSITFLVGHVASSRYGLLKMLGVTDINPFAEQFGAGIGCGPDSQYPPLGEMTQRWSQLAGDLRSTLEGLSDEALLTEPTIRYPTPDKTVRGALAFICWHECYHLGQIGMIRTGLGYPSLRSRVSTGG